MFNGELSDQNITNPTKQNFLTYNSLSLGVPWPVYEHISHLYHSCFCPLLLLLVFQGTPKDSELKVRKFCFVGFVIFRLLNTP